MKTAMQLFVSILFFTLLSINSGSAQNVRIAILNASGQQVATGSINGEGEVTIANIPAGKFSLSISNTALNKQCHIENSCLEIVLQAAVASVGNGTNINEGSTQGKSATSSKNNARREMQPCTLTGVIDWSGRAPSFRLAEPSSLAKGTEYFSVKVKGGNGCTIVRKVTVF